MITVRTDQFLTGGCSHTNTMRVCVCMRNNLRAHTPQPQLLWPIKIWTRCLVIQSQASRLKKSFEEEVAGITHLYTPPDCNHWATRLVYVTLKTHSTSADCWSVADLCSQRIIHNALAHHPATDYYYICTVALYNLYIFFMPVVLKLYSYCIKFTWGDVVM